MAPKVNAVNILGVPDGNTLPTCLGQWDSRQYSLVWVGSGYMVQVHGRGCLSQESAPLNWDEARKVKMGQALASSLKPATLSSTPSSGSSGGAEGCGPFRPPSCTLRGCTEFSKGLSSWGRGRGWWRRRRQYLRPSSAAPTKQMMESTRKYTA